MPTRYTPHHQPMKVYAACRLSGTGLGERYITRSRGVKQLGVF